MNLCLALSCNIFLCAVSQVILVVINLPKHCQSSRSNHLSCGFFGLSNVWCSGYLHWWSSRFLCINCLLTLKVLAIVASVKQHPSISLVAVSSCRLSFGKHRILRNSIHCVWFMESLKGVWHTRDPGYNGRGGAVCQPWVEPAQTRLDPGTFTNHTNPLSRCYDATKPPFPLFEFTTRSSW